MTHISEHKRIKVKDDWYPCFDGDEIGVTIQYFYLNREKTYTVLISAYGKDDYSVELRRETLSKSAALDLYRFWKKYIFDCIPDGITVDWFYEHGFIPA